MEQDANTSVPAADAMNTGSSSLPNQSSDVHPAQKDLSSPSNNGDVDIASIDALPPETSSGEYARNDGVARAETLPADRHTDSPDTRSPEENFKIPVLRTYHGDARNIAQTKGGAELRTVLAKEAEEKRMAQEEYLQKTRDIMKESVVLRDRYKNFSEKQKGDGPLENVVMKAADERAVTNSISGALAYMHSAQAGKVRKEAGGDGGPPVQNQPALKKRSGLFSGVRRKNPEDTFTKEERQSLQDQQKDIVEKESIEGAWKDFQRRKKGLEQKGFNARDVRSYTTSAELSPHSSARKQSVAIVVVVIILLVGLVSSVIYIATQSTETPGGTISFEELQSVPDVINSENRVFVNMSASPDRWPIISKQGDVRNIVNKFVPYEISDQENMQITLDEFSQAFIMRIPPGLRSSWGDYYFVGNYVSQGDVNGIFIVSVKNYSDALIWMLKWEKNVINSFVSVFPTFFRQSNPENTSVESRIIDNKDVRVLRNPLSEKAFMYYFFNRSILVFTAGDEDIIPFINNRIRSANAR